MKRDEEEQGVEEEVNELLEGVEARECHNFIRDTQQVVEDLQSKISNIEEKSIAGDLRLQLVHEQNTIVSLKKELESN